MKETTTYHSKVNPYGFESIYYSRDGGKTLTFWRIAAYRGESLHFIESLERKSRLWVKGLKAYRARVAH